MSGANQQEMPLESDLDADLGLLTIYNTKHVDFKEENTEEFEEQLDDITKQNFNIFLNSIMRIKSAEDAARDAKKLELQIHTFDKTEYQVTLPQPETLFPRFHKMPKKKALTRWEKYMKEKGIQKKKKRSKLVYDEVSGDWVYRYGAKGIKKIREKFDVVREVKPGEDPYSDPWEKDKLQKKLKRQKQELNEVKNKLKAKGQSIEDARTYDQKMQKIEQRKMKLKKLKMKKKKQLNKSLQVAQASTASMGKFDERAHKAEVRRKIKKKSQKVNINSAKAEVERNKEILKLMSRKI